MYKDVYWNSSVYNKENRKSACTSYDDYIIICPYGVSVQLLKMMFLKNF